MPRSMKSNPNITPEQDTMFRRLLQTMSDNMDTPEHLASGTFQRQAGANHFGKPDGDEGFSHSTTTFRFRRYGK